MFQITLKIDRKTNRSSSCGDGPPKSKRPKRSYATPTSTPLFPLRHHESTESSIDASNLIPDRNIVESCVTEKSSDLQCAGGLSKMQEQGNSNGKTM